LFILCPFSFVFCIVCLFVFCFVFFGQTIQ
jgi:hypothetical protein